MNTRLTITIEQSVIDTAKRYAKYRDSSLSDLIENYLKLLTLEADKNDIALTPTVRMLKGSFECPQNFDYKKELADRKKLYLCKK